MALFDGIPLIDSPSGKNSGGLFWLSREASVSNCQEVNDGWIVEIKAGSRGVVARGGPNETHDDTYVAALRAVIQALDLFSMRGIANLTLEDAAEDHAIWWTSKSSLVLCFSSISTLNFDAPLSMSSSLMQMGT